MVETYNQLLAERDTLTVRRRAKRHTAAGRRKIDRRIAQIDYTLRSVGLAA